jgi:AcrR family transcriptional regulator
MTSSRVVDQTTDGRIVRGRQTRQAVLASACAVATSTGLNGLSLGELADQVGISKSGVFARFGSKEGLQLATVEEARRRFIADVVSPGRDEPSALKRLWGLSSRRLVHMRDAYPGGCFFVSVNAEFAAHAGAVRDRLVEIREEWLNTLTSTVNRAARSGEFREGADVRNLAGVLDALAISANGDALLLGDERIFSTAARRSLELLQAVAADVSVLPQRVRLH